MIGCIVPRCGIPEDCVFPAWSIPVFPVADAEDGLP